jgi:hypothetical protein
MYTCAALNGFLASTEPEMLAVPGISAAFPPAVTRPNATISSRRLRPGIKPAIAAEQRCILLILIFLLLERSSVTPGRLYGRAHLKVGCNYLK